MANQLPIGSVWLTSEQPAGSYPYVNVRQSESGHFLMMDDTPGNETVRLQHGKIQQLQLSDSGPTTNAATYLRMMPDGSMETIITGNNFTVVVNDHNVNVIGVCNITVNGDSKLHVYGDCFSQIDKNLIANINGQTKIHAEKDVDMSCAGTIAISAGNQSSLLGGDIRLSASGSVQVKGDLNVSGSITSASAINAATLLTAGYKCYAIGGLETLGGVNVGFSTPGPYIPTGVLTASSLVQAPSIIAGIGNVGMMRTIMTSDMGGFLSQLRTIFNVHTNDGYGNDFPDVGTGPAPIGFTI
jgi:hypothetical protein